MNRKIKNLEKQVTQKEHLLANNKINHILHLLLSVVTGGIWLIIWLLVIMVHQSDNTIIDQIDALEDKIYDLEQEEKQQNQKDQNGQNS